MGIPITVATTVALLAFLLSQFYAKTINYKYNTNFTQPSKCSKVSSETLKLPKESTPCPSTSKELVKTYGRKLALLNDCNYEKYVMAFSPFLQRCITQHKNKDLPSFFLQILLSENHLASKIELYKELIIWLYELGELSVDESFTVLDLMFDNGLRSESVDLALKFFDTIDDFGEVLLERQLPYIVSAVPLQAILLGRVEEGLGLAIKLQNILLTPLMRDLDNHLDKGQSFDPMMVRGPVSNGIVQQLNILCALSLLQEIGKLDETAKTVEMAKEGERVAKKLLQKVDFGGEDMGLYFEMANAFTRESSLKWLAGLHSSASVVVDYTQEEQKMRWSEVAGVSSDNGNWASKKMKILGGGYGGISRRTKLPIEGERGRRDEHPLSVLN